MRIVLGHVVLWLTIVFSVFLGFSDYHYPNAINWFMLLWALVMLAMAVWAIRYPRPAFISISIIYLATAVYRYLILDGEYLLFLLVHIIFITAMVLAIWGAFSKGRKTK